MISYLFGWFGIILVQDSCAKKLSNTNHRL